MTNVRALPRITAVELGTVVWPNGYDLDPDVLHGDHVAVGRSSAQAGPDAFGIRKDPRSWSA
jgi:hypothetical protein